MSEPTEDFSRERLIGMLKPVYDLQRGKTRAQESYDAVLRPLRDWFADHSEETLRDGETGIRARLAGGGDDHLLDFEHLLEADEAALLTLAKRGLLRLDYTGFKAQEETMQHGSTVRRFIYTVPRTRRLVVEKERD
jgi:hypothetical protein